MNAQLIAAYSSVCCGVAGGFLALLDEPEDSLKLYALEQLNEVISKPHALTIPFKVLGGHFISGMMGRDVEICNGTGEGARLALPL